MEGGEVGGWQPWFLDILMRNITYTRGDKAHVSMFKVSSFTLSEIADKITRGQSLLSQKGVILKISYHQLHFPKLL